MMEAGFDYLNVQLHEGGVFAIELNQPRKYNILSGGMLVELTRALGRATEHGAKAVLLSGVGEHFCAGADIMELKAARASRRGMEQFIDRGLETFSALRDIQIPVVCYVKGYCFAGGLELALNADIVLCDDSALFSDQHVKFGFVPGWGGAFNLCRQVGEKTAFELIASGRRLDAQAALRLNLVTEVINGRDLSAVLDYCGVLAKNPPAANRAIKAMIRELGQSAQQAAREREKKLAMDYLMSEETLAGIIKFENTVKARR